MALYTTSEASLSYTLSLLVPVNTWSKTGEEEEEEEEEKQGVR